MSATARRREHSRRHKSENIGQHPLDEFSGARGEFRGRGGNSAVRGVKSAVQEVNLSVKDGFLPGMKSATVRVCSSASPQRW
eukprot:7921951-Pyramimonas_sp.AAC.1